MKAAESRETSTSCTTILQPICPPVSRKERCILDPFFVCVLCLRCSSPVWNNFSPYRKTNCPSAHGSLSLPQNARHRGGCRDRALSLFGAHFICVITVSVSIRFVGIPADFFLFFRAFQAGIVMIGLLFPGSHVTTLRFMRSRIGVVAVRLQ